MRIFTLFDSCSPTDQRTDRRTDKASYRVARPRLKRKLGENITCGSTKSQILIIKTQFTNIQTLPTLFHCLMGKKITVEIRYNGPEGTGEFWLLNPNVVKSNYHCFFVFSFHKKNLSKIKLLNI